MDYIKYLKFNGRYTTQNSDLYFYNVGSGISFKCKGTFLSLTVSFPGKSGYLYVIIDRDFSKKTKHLVNDKNIIDIELDDSMNHYIDVIKANEANDNTMIINDISLNGEFLEYDFAYSKRVKVYGDSTIAGFGILKHDGEPSVATNDGVEDFCFSSLYELGYDSNIFAASGWGLKFSIYTNPKKVGIYDRYKFVSPKSKIKWDDKKNYDLLVVSLGTNDYTFINENGKFSRSRLNNFKKVYEKLIQKESNNNAIPVLMVYGSLNEQYCYEIIEQTYDYIKHYSNNVHLLKLDGDNTGIANHAYVSQHLKMRKQFTSFVESLLK